MEILKGPELPPGFGMLLHDYPYVRKPSFQPKPLEPIIREGEVVQESVDLLRREAGDHRFVDGYFERRLATEAWLYGEGTAMGLPLRDKHPVYFRFAECFSRRPFGNRETIGIPLSALPTDQMTFTLYDSMHNYAKLIGEPYENTPEDVQPTVWTWAVIAYMYQTSQLPAYFFERRQGAPYVECQFWDVNHKVLSWHRSPSPAPNYGLD